MASGASGGEAEHEDVRLHRCKIDGDAAALCETVCDQAGVRMVLDQARHVVVQREDTGRGKDSDLSHGAAQHAAVAVGTRHDVP